MTSPTREQIEAALSEIEGRLRCDSSSPVSLKGYVLPIFDALLLDAEAMRARNERQAEALTHLDPKAYPHMCRDDHDKIGYSGDNERCPVCLMRDDKDAEIQRLREAARPWGSVEELAEAFANELEAATTFTPAAILEASRNCARVAVAKARPVDYEAAGRRFRKELGSAGGRPWRSLHHAAKRSLIRRAKAIVDAALAAGEGR